MKIELKTFQWHCDNCKKIVTTQANELYNARPKSWQTITSSCGDFHCRADHEKDFCPSCSKKLKIK